MVRVTRVNLVVVAFTGDFARRCPALVVHGWNMVRRTERFEESRAGSQAPGPTPED